MGQVQHGQASSLNSDGAAGGISCPVGDGGRGAGGSGGSSDGKAAGRPVKGESGGASAGGCGGIGGSEAPEADPGDEELLELAWQSAELARTIWEREVNLQQAASTSAGYARSAPTLPAALSRCAVVLKCAAPPPLPYAPPCYLRTLFLSSTQPHLPLALRPRRVGLLCCS